MTKYGEACVHMLSEAGLSQLGSLPGKIQLVNTQSQRTSLETDTLLTSVLESLVDNIFTLHNRFLHTAGLPHESISKSTQGRPEKFFQRTKLQALRVRGGFFEEGFLRVFTTICKVTLGKRTSEK